MQENETTIKTFKGFDHELKCRDFQYKVGETYTMVGKVEPCERGFHAIGENVSPLNVFDYYPPSTDGKPSRYCEVELGGETKHHGDKIVGSQIKIGAEIGIPGLAKAHVEWVKNNLVDDDEPKATNTGDQSAATNTGDQSAATNTGYQSAATNTGYHSAATNTGYLSAATNTGYQSAATNTGNRSAATNTGDQSAATNTGYRSAAEVSGKESVAIATGKDCKVKGALGCGIVLAERGDWNGETYPLVGIVSAIVDGETIKPDTWYTVKNGEFVEVKNNEE